ncbi:HlyD family secretion protein [Microvirga flocculans]|uniref:HlyD family secretion protein n=1 Tax=Microvirga flocculans TaxID=217168 RepID=A0A7W6IIN6_9HYPH|nr:efflux RND transporter periplasmic adaptor subunit [Microvirga flocculans]MBB4042199.1 HlyD family secretion protein [Microvirga flocculans]
MAEPTLLDRTGDVDALLDLKRSPRRWGGLLSARLLAAVIVMAALAGGFFYLYNGQSRSPLHFVTEPVTRGNLMVIVTATGSIQPTNKVDVSSELSGTMRKVYVDYNSPVKVGQPLAELDTDKLKATVENSRAKLEAAKALLNVAEVTVWETEQDYNRKQTLVQRSISSVHDSEIAQALYRRAVASLASAKAEVGVAEADLKLNETNLSKAVIYSPINGVVLKRNVDPGQTVASTLQAPVLFSIAEDLTQMEVQVDVDEADVGKVREGQTATFTVDAYPDRKFPATIREVYFASEVVQGVVTYKALLTVDNSDLLLRPGMTATAQISVQEVKDAILVPNAALRFSPPETAPAQKTSLLRSILPGMPRFRPASQKEANGPERKVWILKGDAPVAVPVTVGATDGRHTEITAGEIEPDQAVIVDSTAS